MPAFLLPLFLAAASCIAAGQTGQIDAANISDDPPVRSAPSPALHGAVNIPAADSHGVIDTSYTNRKVIVIGFLGGFARADDQKHPEVQFAEYLRDHYSSEVHAEVFANHSGNNALHCVLHLLDSDGDGNISSAEKDRARIILYGHSWGGTETVVFARELEKRGIPVYLTFQIDSITKPGRDNSKIPANVANAINLYQSRGPLHGRNKIVADDPSRTTILGNLHMTYDGHRINCDNYPWYARTFNKPHHEIENDPRVWDLAASLVDSSIAGSALTARTSIDAQSLGPATQVVEKANPPRKRTAPEPVSTVAEASRF